MKSSSSSIILYYHRPYNHLRRKTVREQKTTKHNPLHWIQYFITLKSACTKCLIKVSSPTRTNKSNGDMIRLYEENKWLNTINCIEYSTLSHLNLHAKQMQAMVTWSDSTMTKKPMSTIHCIKYSTFNKSKQITAMATWSDCTMKIND